MEELASASHNDVLLLTLRVLILLFSARTFGEIAARLGQPTVTGEILAGVVLGPSFLSGLLPGLFAWVLPSTPTQLHQLEVFSLLGAMFLLVLVGMEIDIPMIRRFARKISGAALGGFLLAFLSSFAMAWFLPDTFLGTKGGRPVFAVFTAISISVSAIMVIAKVLKDLNLMRRNIGQGIMAAGMMDDTIAWIFLSILLEVAEQGPFSITAAILSAGKILLFIILSFMIGRFFAGRLLRVVSSFRIPEAHLSLVVMLTLLWGAMARGIGIEAILGAFLVGIVFGDINRLPVDVTRKLEGISLGIFSPIFFAVAGLRVDLGRLLDSETFIVTLIFIATAISGKMAGAYMGGRLTRSGHWNSLAFGAALNTRGAVQIIIASIGLSTGILSQKIYSIIIVMAVFTSLLAPPLLRWIVSRLPPDPEEERRLKQEEVQRNGPVHSLERILFPVRIDPEGASSRIIEAGILNLFASKSRLQIELLNIPETPSEKKTGIEYLRKIRPLFHVPHIRVHSVQGKDPAAVILDEARTGFDLLVLGAPRNMDLRSAGLFNPIIDRVVRHSPCPTLVVSKSDVPWEWTPGKILVPVNGSIPSRNAANFAFQLAGRSALVILVNVIEEERKGLSGLFANPFRSSRLEEIQRGIVDEIAAMGAGFDTPTEKIVLTARTYDREILRYGKEKEVDLILLGTGIRSESAHLFFGSRVENIVAKANCPVAVLNVNE